MGKSTAAELALTVRSTQAGYAEFVLDRLTRLACRTVGAERACLLVCDRRDPRVIVAVAAEGLDEDLVGRRFGADEGVVGRVVRSQKVAAFSDPRELPFATLDGDGGSGACAPIAWDGAVQGALLAVSTRFKRCCGPQELGVLAAVADVAGAALGHAEHRERSAEAVCARVESLAAALELRDQGTGRHAGEVVQLALEVGARLGLEPAALVELEFAARLHDVGKLAVPDAILQKPGPLGDPEWETMRRHPQRGSAMLARIPGLEAVAIVVRFHHERYDGSGYPDGLKGKCIPLASRIVAVCDAYDAIVSDRPYSPARPPAEGLTELAANAGTQFDPEVVEAFLESAGPNAPKRCLGLESSMNNRAVSSATSQAPRSRTPQR